MKLAPILNMLTLKCATTLNSLTSLLSISALSMLPTYIRPKMEYNSHLWAGVSEFALDFVDRIQSRALKLGGDDKVVSSITSLGHRRNVSCIVLFYKYYFGKCSSGLSELIPPPQVFTRNTRLSGRCHDFTVATMSHRRTHYYPYCPFVERLTRKYLS